MSRSVPAPSSVTNTSPCWYGDIVPGSTLMYGSSLRIDTRRPRALSRRPTLAAVMPLPREEVTPPVTKTYFAMGRVLRGFSHATESGCAGQSGIARGPSSRAAVRERSRRDTAPAVHVPGAEPGTRTAGDASLEAERVDDRLGRGCELIEGRRVCAVDRNPQDVAAPEIEERQALALASGDAEPIRVRPVTGLGEETQPRTGHVGADSSGT